MDLEYDMKFEEMKKYIPFLESMIKRLESTGSGTSNPRQAQLDKIRSLRDLLLVKKKRMKMENLLKCEQVLVNLYTKVEQRDTLPGIQPASKVISPKEKSDLNMARNKLKTVSSTPHDPDTLPEIARASETEVVCVPGSKEPALFQRRPNKNSMSPTNKKQSKSPQTSSSKRNYTRVLVSPDRSSRLWSPSDGISPTDQQLFSRRTPPNPSRRYSPSYHKRERKKSSKQDSHTRKSKDFNITLKVPEESLDSLNTKDILSRIINCSDGDVDIATLRELRTQILGELKQTGANEDISDLILKSYKNKRRPNKKDDVEEGELSDSESEAIESIYGNLVVVDKDKNKDTSHKSRSSDEIPRKIQICLVINSDKDQNSTETPNNNDSAKCDVSDFEMFDDNVCNENIQPASLVKVNDEFDKDIISQNTNNLTSPLKVNLNNSQDIITIEDTDSTSIENERKGRDKWVIDMNNFDLQDDSNNLRPIPKTPPQIEPFKANFYKPLFEQTKTSDDCNHEKSVEKFVDIPAVPGKSVELDAAESTEGSAPIAKYLDTSEQISTDKTTDKPTTKDNYQRTCENHTQATDHFKVDKETMIKETKSDSEDKNTKPILNTKDVSNTTNDDILSTKPKATSSASKDNDKDPEIPLLNEPTVHAAKKDVVSEIDILQALKNEILSETIALPCAEVVTPALHQPKVTKVANAQDLPKKRISIENYKQKSSKPSKASLFVTHPSVPMSKDDSRKQSIKLTEKEVERFKIALVDSSDDEEKEASITSPVAEDLAPKSPDVDLVDDVSVCPPVIIPVDPVKTVVAISKADVDMRQMPGISPRIMGVTMAIPSNSEPKKPLLADPKRPILQVDPRVKADKEPLLPTPYPNTAPILPLLPFPNTTPSRTNSAPLMIPNVAPSMTPNRTPCRTPNMTPNRPFETDDSSRKHVYAPMFGAPAQQTSRIWEADRSPVQTPNWEAPVSDRDQNGGRRWDNRDPRNRDDGPRSRFNEPNYDNSYNRARNDRYSKDGPSNPYYGRSDCPATPTPSFGRGDAPATPTHYFGRSEGPRTPSHPFGRSEGPMAANPSFGMSEAPLTPSHSFGRSDAPSTPSHTFGRAETPSTPSRPFGRSDYSYKNQSLKYGKPQDPRLNRNYDNDTNIRKDQPYNDRFRYSRNDPRNINTEQSIERCDNRHYNSTQNSNRDIRREPSGGQTVHQDYDKLYSRDRSGPGGSRSYADVGTRRPFQRESSIGRSQPDQSSRAASVGRSCEKDCSNKVTVKWNAGRAFIIDPSVNSTFQKLLDSHRTTGIDTFDARRQRASSVGRSLTRESSVGRNLSFISSHNNENYDRNKFRRSQSVGRDISRAQSVGRELKERPRNEKSFKDLKAEFESYRKRDTKFRNTHVPKTHDYLSNRDTRCRRDSNDKKLDRPQSSNRTHAKESNMPVKKINHRDPRQRKDQNLRENSVHNQGKRNRSDSRDRHSYGISSESVPKNPVINSVKNYKIPKIKRPVEEKPEVEVTKIETKRNQAKSVEKEVKKQKISSSDKQIEKMGNSGKKPVDKNTISNLPSDKKKYIVESSAKRVTRQSGKRDDVSQSDDDEIVLKTRKFKKVVYHSDSDESTSETVRTSKTLSPKNVSTTKTTTNPNEIELKYIEETEILQESNKNKQLEENQETLDSSFGLDDMDLFSDNIIADPVLDNINALIADLDNDLDAPKGNATGTELFSDMNIENMLAKITTSPVKPNTIKVFTGSPKTCVENVKTDLLDSLKDSDLNDVTEPNKSQSVLEGEKSKSNEIISDSLPSEMTNSESSDERLENTVQPQSEIVNHTDDNNDTEAVVSTSVNEEQTSRKEAIDIESEQNINGCSAPDSTNEAKIMLKGSHGPDRIPDSTIEKQCEMNSDISSTLDSGERQSQFNVEAPKDPATQMDSIGSLLSILQDKSKIKELLSMLGGQSSENEKIKKKLEKLSEIVSDDDDSNVDKIDDSENTKTIIDVNDENETRTSIKENKSIADEQSGNIKIPPTTNETDESVERETKSAVDNESGKMEATKTETETIDSKSVIVTNRLDQTEDSQETPEVTSELQNENDREVSVIKTKTKKVMKRFKTGKFKRAKGGKKVFGEQKRVTRSDGAIFKFKQKPTKKPSRELKQLQESIKEMFLSDDILNASGIRMCRLAKMVDDKNSQRKDSERLNESEPVVVLEKVKHVDEKEANSPEKPLRKKPGPKPKIKSMISPEGKQSDDKKPITKYKPGPKSKTRLVDSERDTDPYDFESDSLNESKTSEKAENSSDSESDSVASSKSFGSSDLLVELKKKPKRKRPGWQAGIIKPKHKKRKVETKRAETPPREPSPEPERNITIPDPHCFTDKKYCFTKNVFRYPCRLCESTHSSSDIVSHYKKHHPHSEIPLSRMSRETAKEAIEQCEEINFQAISKIPTEKYTCRFCNKEFARKRASLEAFFWHVVSMHTGEYKQLCSECINVTRCPFNLDIPPPPKDIKGQLIGYICGKCNFTQISLENLKMHVIVRHNDEQTEVYTINFAVMTKKTINSLVKRCGAENQPRVTRSSRSNQSLTEASDDRSDITESEPEAAHADKMPDTPAAEESQNFSFKSKIIFENDDNASDISNIAFTESSAVKVEADDEDDNQQDTQFDQAVNEPLRVNGPEDFEMSENNRNPTISDDIMDYPHFKIGYTDTGNKEYVCCINGKDNHYKTGLLISMKKHVQLKHSENWDGYCFVCKLIVTTQGQHKFTECLQHFLDKHIDNFPVLEKVVEPERVAAETVAEASGPPERASTPKNYINVRPLAELLVKTCEPAVEAPEAFPVIENVVSLLPATVEAPRPSPTYPVTRKEVEPPKEYKYEEPQAEIMSRKHRVVLDAMMAPEKLVQVFKCAGRFCSFTADSAEDALLHASTHQRVGGTSALLCAYCDFDASGNSIDLVSHVFKNHGRCPYACGLCFYRAAASQLVGAHVARVHGTPPAPERVLTAHNAPAASDSTEGNMTREVAVPLYVCRQTDREGACSFKTVMHSKFCEHLIQKHDASNGFICYVCNATCTDAPSLVLHLKTHGLRVFHCTLCVFGADGEAEMLAHASARHPAKRPQAYIRTILGSTTTGGLKILPLVELKKNALSPQVVAPGKAKENPVREAERSIELETLIGHITQDEPAEPARGPEPAPADNLSNEVEEAVGSALENPDLMPVPPLAPLSAAPRPATPLQPPAAGAHSNSLAAVLKEEPKDTTPEKTNSDVICLDSDEEDSKQGIISLSDDDNPASEEALAPPKKIPANNLYKCGKCNLTCSTPHGFKKHLCSCYLKSSGPFPCAHCPYSTGDANSHFTHYQKAHSAPLPYSCGLCSHAEPSLPRMKLHIKKIHNVNKVVVKSIYGDVGEIVYMVSGTPDASKPAKPIKRKSSGATPLTPTKKRYGPSDIEKLPVKPILDESVYCEMCEFNTKVRLNMVRHLQLHAEQQPVPQTAPVNPVPHLETNEKHFDKMVNLASSSAATRPQPEKTAKEPTPVVLIPAELATRYPKFVPERHRHTCGARGCSYISVDEGMLRRHWDTLHSGTTDYHCVHCPPYQHLDKSKPLTAARIIAHLKMHDIRLYACSVCPYYHYKRQVLEKHMSENHASSQVLVVREEAAAAPPAPLPAAPTMDLKPWQCGLCKFKSMLRAEVADHCFKSHSSKMQFKCAYCPFRTSTSENVTKHQLSSHPNREPEIFYFYYREGSIPDDADGTQLWQKQRQKTGLDATLLVKAELAEVQTSSSGAILPQIQPRPAPEGVNLSLVKQEVDPDIESETENLCKKFGEFCEPNGLNYKCSLCKVTVEDSKEAMQSHLFEELEYRKWGCRLCSYKAFHQTGLKEHMWTEHRQNQEPIELPVDASVEAWVSQLLNYQEDLIKKNKEKLTQQKIQGERVTAPSTSKTVEVTNSAACKLTVQELEKYFGPLGTSSNMMFSCPKCSFKSDNETSMQDHLEAELTKIRWCCSSCPNHYTTYHSAQFHCKSVHAGQAARPVEAARDPAVRAAWVAAALAAQARRRAPAPPPAADGSLLVVRYEEPVPTPEEETLRRAAADSDDDARLVVADSSERAAAAKCPYCEFKTKYPKILKCHVLRHYNLKPYTCPYCQFDGYKPAVLQHIAAEHPEHRAFAVNTAKPAWPPSVLDLAKPPKKPTTAKKLTDDDLVCLTCEDVLGDTESKMHVHEKISPRFAKKGAVVVKCCDCLLLLPDVVAMQRHYTDFHSDLPINYAYYKLLQDTRDLMLCYHCNQRFSHLIDLKSHHKANHGLLKLQYSTIPYVPGANEMPIDLLQNLKRKSDAVVSPPKRCARKSTTKLPRSQAVAKKSTSKLPFYVDSDSESENEYSYYGTEPTSWDELSNVTTMMPFCNTVVPFTLQKLSEIIKLNPKVVVKDCKK